MAGQGIQRREVLRILGTAAAAAQFPGFSQWAFACGHVIAWVYMFTHSGLSYSRSFVNALIVMPTIVSLVMMVLQNNLITAFTLFCWIRRS